MSTLIHWFNPFVWSNLWQGVTIILLTVQTFIDAHLIRKYKKV